MGEIVIWLVMSALFIVALCYRIKADECQVELAEMQFRVARLLTSRQPVGGAYSKVLTVYLEALQELLESTDDGI